MNGEKTSEDKGGEVPALFAQLLLVPSWHAVISVLGK